MRRLTLAAILSLAGCTAAPSPKPIKTAAAPPPVIVVPVLPPKPVDWRDRPYAAGSWRYADGSASFGPVAAPLLTMRCDRARRIVVLAVAGSAPSLRLRTSYAEREWPAQPTGDGRTAISFAASDPALDQIAFSRGRFSIAGAGIAEIDVPAWAEPGRVIEDCRG